MNKIFLTGNLIKDPEMKITQDGLSITSFVIAQNTKDKDKPEFYAITCFRNTAENVALYCQKGSKVLVEGSIKHDEYTDKEGGKQRKLVINAIQVEFLSSIKKEEN